MLFFPVYNESDPRPLFGLPLTAACTLLPISYPPNPLPCPPKLFRINTCKSVSKQTALTHFRMNTYEKQRGEGAPPTFPSRNARKHFAHPLFFSTTCAMPLSQLVYFGNDPFSWGVYPPPSILFSTLSLRESAQNAHFCAPTPLFVTVAQKQRGGGHQSPSKLQLMLSCWPQGGFSNVSK